MANILNTFKVVSDSTQNIVKGSVFNGIMQDPTGQILGINFASGETTKYLLCEIPAGMILQFLGQGLTMTPYDDTFLIRLMEDVTSLTTGTTNIIVRNMNRNFSGTQQTVWTMDPVGTYGGEGTVIEDFNPFERRRNYLNASKTIKEDIERIFKTPLKYLFVFTRTTDTTVLNIEYRFIWSEDGTAIQPN